MTSKELDLKQLKKRVKDYVKSYGLSEAEKYITKHYEFFPKLQKTLLFILYDEYYFYPFINKDKF